jgi:hypothetical protein
MDDREPNELPSVLHERQHAEVKHESRDVRFRVILVGAVATCVAGALLQLAVFRFYGWQLEKRNAEAVTTFPLAPEPSSNLPPEPRLEPLERVERGSELDAGELYAPMEHQLHAYGETDDERFVHVPIEQAMKALAGKLAVRDQTDQKLHRDYGLVDSGEPNSGRLLREEPE